MSRAFWLVMQREFALAFRRWSDLALPWLFFIIVCTLFPLAIGQDPLLLQVVGPGAIWVAALLATLLSLNSLFRSDFADGSLEQLALSEHPLTVLLLAKSTAHWLTTQLPLVILAPLLGLSFDLSAPAIQALTLTLLIGTPALTMLGSVAAALTAGLQQASGLLALLLLPLCVPILIFGARSVALAANGESVVGSVYLLAAISVLAITLTPFATAAAVRISLD
jgi:heme exporter protein B